MVVAHRVHYGPLHDIYLFQSVARVRVKKPAMRRKSSARRLVMKQNVPAGLDLQEMNRENAKVK